VVLRLQERPWQREVTGTRLKVDESARVDRWRGGTSGTRSTSAVASLISCGGRGGAARGGVSASRGRGRGEHEEIYIFSNIP